MYDSESKADVPTAAQLAPLSNSEARDTKRPISSVTDAPESIEPPPPYSLEAVSIQSSSSCSAPRSTSQYVLTKPIVVPQTTKVGLIDGGAYASLFARAYCPHLSQLNDPISPQEFLDFVDGLNETFISHPAFQVGQMTGNALTMVPLPPLMWARLSLQVASGMGSTAVSHARVKNYMKIANKKLFAPRGLKAMIMKTTGMIEAVRYPDPEFTG
ncbi:hypothetical protein EV356DRAFT_518117 [Viridothelium virens]|uniref:Uncharacterized protein n=1 Tax=Viridothelium virens TaxID=1048519 RepID=A0A6A6H218_VIRVR|nr:hypothetical protein EV356DRAFT_518117 [Viridothelium virens]